MQGKKCRYVGIYETRKQEKSTEKRTELHEERRIETSCVQPQKAWNEAIVCMSAGGRRMRTFCIGLSRYIRHSGNRDGNDGQEWSLFDRNTDRNPDRL